MVLELGSLGTISAWVLVTRGPVPAFCRLNREEGGSLVTRFRTGLVPQGPPAQEILGSQGPPGDHAGATEEPPRDERSHAVLRFKEERLPANHLRVISWNNQGRT